MKNFTKSIAFGLAFFVALVVKGQNESEPNNNYLNANFFATTGISGNVGTGADADDYFYFVPAQSGTVKVFIQFNNPGPTLGSDLYAYAYNKKQVLIGSNSITNPPLGSGRDSVILTCREADTLFFRLNAYGTFTYTVTYAVVATGTNDTEPNNTYAQAPFIPYTGKANGRIGHTSTTTDVDDYYKIYIPANGQFKLFTKLSNTSGSTDADFYIYIYNRNKGLIASKSLTNRLLGINPTDTLIVQCREADTMYVRYYATTGCFSYELSYGVNTTGTNDVEPNNDFTQSRFIGIGTPANGRIGHTGTTTDADDYYKIYIPANGQFKLFTTVNNTSGSTDADFYIYIYNRNKSLIASKSLANRPLGLNPTDTVIIYSREADTMYVRYYAGGDCFAYQFSYEVNTTGINDAEPNNNFKQSTFIGIDSTANGRIGHTGTTTDADDYFKIYIPANGQFKLFTTLNNTAGTDESDFYIYLYNRGTSMITSKGLTNRKVGLNPTDTLIVHCREADTMYVRYTAGTGSFAYQFNYEVNATGINDAEPNNTFAQASFIPHTSKANGRIGHTGTTTDAEDYFKIYIPANGQFKLFTTINNTSGSTDADFYIYLFNRNKSLIASKSLTNRQLGLNLADTLIENCREADTMYVRYNGSSGCFAYQFSYEVNSTGTNDVEPNNTLATSTLISTADTLRGKIGHTGTSTDAYDFFKFYAGKNSRITLKMKVSNTSGSTGSDFYMNLYKRNGQAIIYKSYANQPLTGFTDSVTVSCVASDTVVIGINSSGCFSYNIVINAVDISPIANISSARIGNTFSFIANTTNTDIKTWNFGDGTTSTLKYPKKEFGIGSYYVTLKAQNTKCNLVHIDTLFAEVKGIEYFTPQKAGSGGDAMMQIFGGGLDTTTQVTLRKGAQLIKPFRKYGSPARNELQVEFNLHLADAGLYDVIIEIPGEPIAEYKNNFEILELEYPYTSSEIIGPDRWRVNRDTRYVLSVNNRGNVKANGVVAMLVWPKSVEINFLTEWFKPPTSGTVQIDVDDTRFNWKYEDIQSFYAKENTWYTAIDSFAGKPYDGYFMKIMIAQIPAGGTYDLPFLAKSSSIGDKPFITYTSKPNLFGSCENGTWLDATENLGVEMADALDTGLGIFNLDKTPLGWIAKGLKGSTKAFANLGTSMGALYNYADGTTQTISQSLPAHFDANVSAAHAQMAGAVLEVGTDLLVDAGAGAIMKGKTDDLNKWLANNPDASMSSFEFAIDQLNDIDGLRDLVKNAYKTGKDLKTLNDKVERLKQLAEDCPELQKQIDDIQKELDKEMQQREKKEKDTRTVTSMDPNAIYGPTGIGAGQFVNHLDNHTYMVTFENVDSATASAQVVKVTIPIDTLAFDLSTFKFGNSSIGTKSYNVPINRKEFTYDVNFNKTKSYIVRVMGSLDVAKGVINCEFITLDTTTLDLPVLEGFLPPNKLAPEGEGSIIYSVALKTNIADGYKTSSQAQIVFDENEAILTNTWENIVDREPSTSFPVATISGTSDITIALNGTDSQSGVDYYYLYVSENGGEWVALTGSTENTLKLKGEPGKHYDFYSSSTDRVGNAEVKTPSIESSITVALSVRESESSKQQIEIIPNPSNGNVIARANGNYKGVEVRVYNTTGQLTYSASHDFIVGQSVSLDLTKLPVGVYMVHFINKSGVHSVKKLLIVK